MFSLQASGCMSTAFFGWFLAEGSCCPVFHSRWYTNISRVWPPYLKDICFWPCRGNLYFL